MFELEVLLTVPGELKNWAFLPKKSKYEILGASAFDKTKYMTFFGGRKTVSR